MDAHTDQDLTTHFRYALRGVAASVCVITTIDGEQRHGMTATSVTSLTMEPPALLVCLNRTASLAAAVRITQGFCVNFLSEGHEDVSKAFSGGVKPEERFSTGGWREQGETGLPYLEDAQSVLFCRKTAALPYGTHIILIGDVVEAKVGDISQPLVYHDAGYAALRG